MIARVQINQFKLVSMACFVIGVMFACSEPEPNKPEPKQIEKSSGDETTMLEFSNVEPAWKISKGAGVKVAVCDWLFDLSEEASAKYVSPASMIPDMGIGELDAWHGEWMAGIVHLIAPNAKIIPIRCNPGKDRDDPDDDFEKHEKYLWAGIKYAADHGAVAVTNSMGPVKQCEQLTEAIDYAEERGTIFVDVHPEYLSFNGEQYTFADSAGSDPRIIHVGVVGVPDHKVEPEAARDVYVWPYQTNPVHKDGWGFSNGPPQVAAVIALMKSANPGLTTDEVREIIVSTAFEIHGFRVLDAEAAVEEAINKKMAGPKTDPPY